MTCINCRRLREENDELHETVTQLKALLIPADAAHHMALRFGLTAKQSLLVAALVEHGFKTRQQLLDAMYFGAEVAPDIKIVDVYVCKVRKKLRPHGLDIVTVWGRGHSMSDKHRNQIKTLCARDQAPNAA